MLLAQSPPVTSHPAPVTIAAASDPRSLATGMTSLSINPRYPSTRKSRVGGRGFNGRQLCKICIIVFATISAVATNMDRELDLIVESFYAGVRKRTQLRADRTNAIDPPQQIWIIQIVGNRRSFFHFALSRASVRWRTASIAFPA